MFQLDVLDYYNYTTRMVVLGSFRGCLSSYCGNSIQEESKRFPSNHDTFLESRLNHTFSNGIVVLFEYCKH